MTVAPCCAGRVRLNDRRSRVWGREGPLLLELAEDWELGMRLGVLLPMLECSKVSGGAGMPEARGWSGATTAAAPVAGLALSIDIPPPGATTAAPWAGASQPRGSDAVDAAADYRRHLVVVLVVGGCVDVRRRRRRAAALAAVTVTVIVRRRRRRRRLQAV